jgi:hypothetical protein
LTVAMGLLSLGLHPWFVPIISFGTVYSAGARRCSAGGSKTHMDYLCLGVHFDSVSNGKPYGYSREATSF